jgi:hypothetical protein
MRTPVPVAVVETSSSARVQPSSGEHSLTAAEQDRLDHQPIFVDKVMLDQLRGQRRAAHDLYRFAIFGAQRTDRADRIVGGQQGRTGPGEVAAIVYQVHRPNSSASVLAMTSTRAGPMVSGSNTASTSRHERSRRRCPRAGRPGLG